MPGGPCSCLKRLIVSLFLIRVPGAPAAILAAPAKSPTTSSLLNCSTSRPSTPGRANLTAILNPRVELSGMCVDLKMWGTKLAGSISLAITAPALLIVMIPSVYEF